MRKTALTEMLQIDQPIIAAPMFLVSNEDIVVAASEAGAIGTTPSLNFRPAAEFDAALARIAARTKKPIGVNLIVNKSNPRAEQDLEICVKHRVNLIITSLGNPKEVIKKMHAVGGKVFCDVTNLEHALKVEDLGADGVIAVGAGAGGHAGPLSPLVLIPWLKERLKIPIIAAGGIAQRSQVEACLALGAAGVSVGTRFIASTEARVDERYKQAILQSTPEDIIMTKKISGTPAAVIRTPEVEAAGTELAWWLTMLRKNPKFKKWADLLIHTMGMRELEKSAGQNSWKSVWSAGQSVGLIHDIKPVAEIVKDLSPQ